MRYASDDDELMDAGLLEPWLENWVFQHFICHYGIRRTDAASDTRRRNQ